MLRDFLREHRYETVTTADFIRTAETHLGSKIDWFWEQWVYGSLIPKVRWDYRVESAGDKWALSVEAEQDGSDFVLWMPVYVRFKGDRLATRPVRIDANGGTLSLRLPEKPLNVTVNDNWEVLADVTRR